MRLYVSFFGQVELLEVQEMSRRGLSLAVSSRFGLGDRLDQLRFTTDQDEEVLTDDRLKRLAQEKQVLRVMIGDALSGLEQRMWQFKQLQLGLFQDELARVKKITSSIQIELKALRQTVERTTQRDDELARQVRQALEKSARRDEELAGELVAERHQRERGDAAAAERYKQFAEDVRRELQSVETLKSALRVDFEDARQKSMKLAAAAEKDVQDLKTALAKEIRNHSQHVQDVLAQLTGGQAELRQAIDAIHTGLELCRHDVDGHSKELLRETSARQAFEQFFGERLQKVEDGNGELGSKLLASVREVHDAARSESERSAASRDEIHRKLSVLELKAAGGTEAAPALPRSAKSPNFLGYPSGTAVAITRVVGGRVTPTRAVSPASSAMVMPAVAASGVQVVYPGFASLGPQSTQSIG
eukprot:CAMPEP_0117534304 /NCGR_PEP_ID=MMETSP0784-20121206/40341_1 /TAXON_ID=39447 /ORGANISM="" /LENGTH=416 /DNA_ID=CAMNT_0005330777 /DNA_START=59 /DNA_END=1309 /DNA_ORIENTATION=-